MRRVARVFSSAVDRVSKDFAKGHGPGLLTLGPARIGDVICFEVSDDTLVRRTVDAGAQLITVQTNNATFGRTPETKQQLAMSRLRAVEHGRWVLVASTSGISAAIAPDGKVVQRTGLFTPAEVVQSVRLSDARTPADRLGNATELLLVLLGVAAVALGSRRTTQRGDDAGDDERASRPRMRADLRRGAEPRADRVAHPRSRPRRRRPGRRRPQPGRYGRARRPPGRSGLPGPRTAPAGQGGPRGCVPRGVHAGRSTRATTSSWRWTPTARTAPRTCPCCWRLSTTGRTSRSGRGGSMGERSQNWPKHRALALPGWQRVRAARAGDPGARRHRWVPGLPGATLKGLDLDEVASQGYCFQVDLVWRALQRGFRVAGGADHLRRARAGREQDEPRHRGARPCGGSPSGARRRRAHQVAAAVRSSRGAAREPCFAFLLFVVAPLVEIASIVLVAQWIGWWTARRPGRLGGAGHLRAPPHRPRLDAQPSGGRVGRGSAYSRRLGDALRGRASADLAGLRLRRHRPAAPACRSSACSCVGPSRVGSSGASRRSPGRAA